MHKTEVTHTELKEELQPISHTHKDRTASNSTRCECVLQKATLLLHLSLRRSSHIFSSIYMNTKI